jgi:hypothetical protein
MNKWIVLLVLLVAAGCGNMSTWVMTGHDTDLTTRVGIEPVDGVEAGITAKWDCASEIEWGPEPDQTPARRPLRLCRGLKGLWLSLTQA